MAKRKNKQLSLIIDLVVIALGVLVVCTLFMPVLKSTASTSIMGGASTSSPTTGADIVKGFFSGEASSDFTAGANAIIGLKNSDENGFVTVMFCLFYSITVIAGAGVAVFAVLDLVGIRFKLINTILGIILFLASIIALIFAFVVAGKYVSVDLWSVAKASTKVNIGGYIMIAGVFGALANLYKVKS